MLRALARAAARGRAIAQFALIAALIGVPYNTFLADHWISPETAYVLPSDRPQHFNVVATVTDDSIERVAPVARGAPPAPLATTPTPAPSARTPAPIANAPTPALSGGAYVYASWYGPGFYGNRTACGQTFTSASWGVAHKTLRCGTIVQITYRGHTVSAPVIDRGPYVAGREVDLSSAVAAALGFAGVQQIYLVIP